mmetsp:Transcript_18140/g.59585  ORF Transcript_18140/g.59585 Transcript_18140/m.59585 type:complete len:108 (+) Transcript_18140:1852-2175(+)
MPISHYSASLQDFCSTSLCCCNTNESAVSHFTTFASNNPGSEDTNTNSCIRRYTTLLKKKLALRDPNTSLLEVSRSDRRIFEFKGNTAYAHVSILASNPDERPTSPT